MDLTIGPQDIKPYWRRAVWLASWYGLDRQEISEDTLTELNGNIHEIANR